MTSNDKNMCAKNDMFVTLTFYLFIFLNTIKIISFELNVYSILTCLLFTVMTSIAYFSHRLGTKIICSILSIGMMMTYLIHSNIVFNSLLINLILISSISVIIFRNFYFSISVNGLLVVLILFHWNDYRMNELFLLLSNMTLLIILNKTRLNVSELKEINSNLYLPNQSIALNKLSTLIETYKNMNETKFAVAILDLDCLKTINKQEGYDSGDYIILQVTQRILRKIDKKHLVVRSGGDEFTIIFSEIQSKKEIIKQMNDILVDLRKTFIYHKKSLHISASVGIVFNDPKFISLDEYLRAASISLEKAKMNGRNRISLFDNLKDEDKIRRFKIEKDLKLALVHYELMLVYQPIIQLKTQKEVGLEALIRWNHPELGVISPNEFIPIAEQSGFIVEIGKYVIEEACKTLYQISPFVSDQFAININISPKQLKDENLYNVINFCIKEYHLKPERIHFEITESALIDDLEVSKITLNKLVELGIKIHLDDFGTGYSSLSYLHSLPITSLKIDKSFIHNLQLDQKNDQLLKSIILMGKELNMTVIAEGIEGIKHYNRLVELGCEFGQGFYFSKPLRNSELLLYLENKYVS